MDKHFNLKTSLTCPYCNDNIETNNSDEVVSCKCGRFGVDHDALFTRVSGLKELDKIRLLINEIEIPEGYKVTENKKVIEMLREKLSNDRHCPCQIKKTDDTLCVCKQFRDTGICKCGLWVKE